MKKEEVEERKRGAIARKKSTGEKKGKITF